MITCDGLLMEYRKKHVIQKGENIQFLGVEPLDVYNITAPFALDGKNVIAGRVESRESEHSVIRLFEKKSKNSYVVISDGIELPLQDPFHTTIDGKLILGGVEVEWGEKIRWRTVFYHLISIYDAQCVFKGPWGMKDLRLKQLSDNSIAVFTRPQGGKAARGKIGFTKVSSLEKLNNSVIENAPLMNYQFIDEEWGGSNEIHEINGRLYVLGHISKFDLQKNLHYYPFVFEAKGLDVVNPHIIAERREFEACTPKRSDLEDVVFSGGIIREDNEYYLYAGIGDSTGQRIKIENPFY